MTPTHIVNGTDEIAVEGVGGEVVRPNLISSDGPLTSPSCNSSG